MRQGEAGLQGYLGTGTEVRQAGQASGGIWALGREKKADAGKGRDSCCSGDERLPATVGPVVPC